MLLNFPAGLTEFTGPDGVKHKPDANGQVEVAAGDLGPFLAQGFMPDALALAATVAVLAGRVDGHDTDLGTLDGRVDGLDFSLADLAALYTPFMVAASQTELTIKTGTLIKVINQGLHTLRRFDADTTFAVADYLDTGVIEAGKDYYVYLCDDGQIKVSLNSTYPAGYTAANSRKIGGFHTLCCAVGTISGHPLTGYVATAILPNSVWCLNFRSNGQQEGHQYSPTSKLWGGIYGQSSTGATTGSVYGATITDTRAHSDHIDDLGAVGDRLLKDHEFQLMAAGSNEKTALYGGIDPVSWGKCRIYLSKTGTWAAGIPASAWIDRSAYVPPVAAANEAQEYVITISTGHASDPNFFTYTKRNPAGTPGATSAPIQITGASQALADGLTITFPAAVGWVTGETATWVVMNGLVDSANRRMISYEGFEAMCGVMWQWLLDQNYRFDRGAVAYVAGGKTTTLYHAAAPGGNPIYVKFGLDGTPYLCCNMAAAVADKILSFGADYKVVVKHDADAATGGLPLYFDYDATLPYRFLVNNTIFGKNCYGMSNDPNYLLPLLHDANAATNGAAVNYDDGADNQLEYISPGAANATMDLAMTHTEPPWNYVDPGGNKGSLYIQGPWGDVKSVGGGAWSSGSAVHCGSRSRYMSLHRWNATNNISGRGCADSK